VRLAAVKFLFRHCFYALVVTVDFRVLLAQTRIDRIDYGQVELAQLP
jgi:hypothetical protein